MSTTLMKSRMAPEARMLSFTRFRWASVSVSATCRSTAFIVRCAYQAPAVFAAQLTAMGDQLRASEPLRRSPIAPSAQRRRRQTSTLVAAG